MQNSELVSSDSLFRQGHHFQSVKEEIMSEKPTSYRSYRRFLRILKYLLKLAWLVWKIFKILENLF